MHHVSIPSVVSIGGMGRPDLLRALDERNVHLNHAAKTLFEDRRFTTFDRQQIIQIVALSVADLGLDAGGTYGQITARAMDAGLVECPLETAPHLRMQFLDQAEGSHKPRTTHKGAPSGSITVASAPLDDRDETAKGFYLRCIDGVFWLRGYWSSHDHVWSPEDVLVFSSGRRPD